MAVADSPLLRALARQPAAKTPLWVMRQAGRYLPEYRKVRAQAGSFLGLCRNPELACEVTLQPIERFGLDAAIIFSDILVIPDALGLGLGFADGEGPYLERPLRSEADVSGLGALDVAALASQQEALRLARAALPATTPLIGFAGGPFTLACYMVDGRGGDFVATRKLMAARPDLMATIIERNSAAAIACLAAQAEAGADVLMLFESWAQLVPLPQARAWLVEPLARIVAGLRAAGVEQPVIAFLRNAGELAPQAAATGVACLGVDWRSDLAALSAALGGKVALQGNLDPAVLLTDPATIRTRVQEVIASFRAPAGHIFNLGHGIDRRTPVANVEALVAAVAEFGSAGA